MGRADTIRASEEGSGDIVDKTPPDFTLDDLLSELADDEPGERWTVRELCEKAGLPTSLRNMQRVWQRVNDLKAEGLWEDAPQKRLWSEAKKAMLGRPAYRPVKNGEEG